MKTLQQLEAEMVRLNDEIVTTHLAADAIDLANEYAEVVQMLVEALRAVKRHQEMNVKSNTTAMMGTTWHIVTKALTEAGISHD